MLRRSPPHYGPAQGRRLRNKGAWDHGTSVRQGTSGLYPKQPQRVPHDRRAETAAPGSRIHPAAGERGVGAPPGREILPHTERLLHRGLPGAGGAVPGLYDHGQPQRFSGAEGQGTPGDHRGGDVQKAERGAVRRCAPGAVVRPPPVRGGPAVPADCGGRAALPGGRGTGSGADPEPGHPHEPGGQRRV